MKCVAIILVILSILSISFSSKYEKSYTMEESLENISVQKSETMLTCAEAKVRLIQAKRLVQVARSLTNRRAVNKAKLAKRKACRRQH